VGGPTNRTIPEPGDSAERLPLAPRPKPAGPLPAPPLVYQAVSDIKVYPKPPLPKMGPAGFSLDDPTFGCRILRVTDENTMSGDPLVTPARAEQNPWNADGTRFCVLTMDQRNVPFRFNPATMTATRIEGLPTLPGIHGNAPFSYHDSDVCYGKDARRGAVVQYDFQTGRLSEICDVGRATGLPLGHMEELTVSATDVLALNFGGSQQDTDPYLMTYDMRSGAHHVWNTREGTLDGKPLPTATRFTQHNSHIDRSGRYVWTEGPGKSGPTVMVWDVEKGSVYPLTVSRTGHNVAGYGEMVNDINRWIYRTLDPVGIDQPHDLMQHPAGEPYFSYDSHLSWNNARPGMHVPVVASTYHALERGDPRCAYGDEIVAVATDGSRRVWRLAHHRSIAHARIGDAASKYSFWDSPRGNVSQDGRFQMFTSNWEETLGKDRRGHPREDVFIVKLQCETADPGTK